MMRPPMPNFPPMVKKIQKFVVELLFTSNCILFILFQPPGPPPMGGLPRPVSTFLLSFVFMFIHFENYCSQFLLRLQVDSFPLHRLLPLHHQVILEIVNKELIRIK